MRSDVRSLWKSRLMARAISELSESIRSMDRGYDIDSVDHAELAQWLVRLLFCFESVDNTEKSVIMQLDDEYLEQYLREWESKRAAMLPWVSSRPG